MQVSWKWISGIVCVLLFCTAVGCMSFTTTKSSNSNPSQGSSGESGGGSGGSGGGSGGSSSGSYPQNTYFSFDCKGEWKDTTISGSPPWNHHGKFTVIGNVPFPILYDYNLLGYGMYPDVNAGRSDRSNPLHIQGESQECEGPANDCKPCHFVFDGEIYAGGVMVFNQSAGPGRRWIVSFSPMPGGENGIWHTNSIQQTEGGCPITDIEQYGPLDIILPAHACFTANRGSESGNSFTFSDGSGFAVEPHLDPDNTEFSKLEPHVVFHIGRAPS
jgi:hypothetical protein